MPPRDVHRRARDDGQLVISSIPPPACRLRPRVALLLPAAMADCMRLSLRFGAVGGRLISACRCFQAARLPLAAGLADYLSAVMKKSAAARLMPSFAGD